MLDFPNETTFYLFETCSQNFFAVSSGQIEKDFKDESSKFRGFIISLSYCQEDLVDKLKINRICTKIKLNSARYIEKPVGTAGGHENFPQCITL